MSLLSITFVSNVYPIIYISLKNVLNSFPMATAELLLAKVVGNFCASENIVCVRAYISRIQWLIFYLLFSADQIVYHDQCHVVDNGTVSIYSQSIDRRTECLLSFLSFFLSFPRSWRRKRASWHWRIIQLLVRTSCSNFMILCFTYVQHRNSAAVALFMYYCCYCCPVYKLLMVYQVLLFPVTTLCLSSYIGFN